MATAMAPSAVPPPPPLVEAPPATVALPGRPKPVDICKLAPGAAGETVAALHPFTPVDPQCEGEDHFCDQVEHPPDRRDACFVANSNIRRAERDALSSKSRPALQSSPWDGRSKPAMLDRVDAHLHLTDDEQALLAKQGFVVLDRLPYDSYATAYHDVFQQQLPVFVSIDSVLHSVFQANGSILQDIETNRLQPKLGHMLDRLRATLAKSQGNYDATTRHDLDVYLAVPRRLVPDVKADGTVIQPAEKLTVFGDPADEALAESLVEKAASGQELEAVELFGRSRMIDFSQYTARGHYTGGRYGVTLVQYFEAMMWLSRLELNLVSRSCRSSQPGESPDPSETPREARDAIALADLVERSGELGDLRAFEDVYSVFAGGRQDVSVVDMLALAKGAGLTAKDPAAPEKLRAAIGERFQRTARTHFMPEGSPVLPAIMTLFGPRIVPDVAPLTRLVHDSVPERRVLGAADVAFVLGHDRAKASLAKDLATFPSLGPALDGARAELRKGAAGKKDLYGLWLTAVMRLAEPAQGAEPSFMKTDAYADYRINSALVGFGQIRHNYVLLAGQGYDAYGCEIPDGYVEPALGTYDALLAYVRAARAVTTTNTDYFRRVEQVITMLRSIVVTELSGAPLAEAQKRWLGMVAEYIPVGGWGGDSGQPPKWTGWYFDLFPDRHIGAEMSADFIADYFTLTNAGQVRYLGAETPRLGVFIVDVNGEARAMVGPAAKGYELATPIGPRLDDEKAREAKDKSAGWQGYMAPALAPDKTPKLAVDDAACGPFRRVVVTSPVSVGDVTVTLLDHHGDPVSTPVTRPVGPAGAVFDVRGGDGGAPSADAVHVQVHDLATAGLGHGRYDMVVNIHEWRGGPFPSPLDPPPATPY